MAARRSFWKWCRWKSIGFCLWPPSTCLWNLKLKFQSKLDLCSGNHVVYRQTDGQTDGRTDGRTRWIQYTPSNFVGQGTINQDYSQQIKMGLNLISIHTTPLRTWLAQFTTNKSHGNTACYWSEYKLALPGLFLVLCTTVCIEWSLPSNGLTSNSKE